MIPFTHKLVAVVNEKLESGVAMNAVAHMSIGLGSFLGKERLRLSDYIDADQGSHPHISEMPFIILKTNSNKLRNLRKEALAHGIHFTDFTNTMTVGTYVEQIELTKKTKEEELIYYGVVLYGEWEKVSELTRKFSLLK